MKKLTEVSESFKANEMKKIQNMGFVTEAGTVIADFTVVAERDGDHVDVKLMVHGKSAASKRISLQEAGSGSDVYSKAFDLVENLLK